MDMVTLIERSRRRQLAVAHALGLYPPRIIEGSLDVRGKFAEWVEVQDGGERRHRTRELSDAEVQAVRDICVGGHEEWRP